MFSGLLEKSLEAKKLQILTVIVEWFTKDSKHKYANLKVN